MFKRPRLSAEKRLVNALPGLVLLFLTAACNGPADAPEQPTLEPQESPASTELTLPAVWSTRALDGPISSIGVAGALGSTIAVSYQDGGLQFFNFEGDRVTDKAPLDVSVLGDGRYLLLSDVPVTVFPGISTQGEIEVYIHGGQLPEPIAYALDVGAESRVTGLCTSLPEAESDGVMRMAFWTADQPSILNSGRIVQVGEDLVYLPDDPVTANAPISACLLEEIGATVYSAPALAAVSLDRRGKINTITLDTSGNYNVSHGATLPEPLSIRDGITVRAAPLPVDIAGTGDTRGGGYPGGILVIAGEDEAGEHRLVFVDPSQLTLTPFE